MPDSRVKSDLSREECLSKLKELISGIKVAMMTTVGPDGNLHSRPMWSQQADQGREDRNLEFSGDLWFFSSNDSLKTQELQTNGHTAVTYADPHQNRYVSAYGRGQVVNDRAMAEKLWSEAFRAWCPGRLDDPRLCLIRVSIERAEYWDSPSSRVVHLIGFIKAAATDKPYQPLQDEHGNLDIAG